MSDASATKAITRSAPPVCLDYAATTPVDRRDASKMIPFLPEICGSPASRRSDAFNWAADEAVELAREQVSALINADPREIAWTSGATESNKLALKGAAHFYKGKGKHLVAVVTEHKAVFEAALRPDTVLASVMVVHNETGVIQDVEAMGALCRTKKVLFHVDAAQAAGKVAIDLEQLPLDMMSLSAHKIEGESLLMGQVQVGIDLDLIQWFEHQKCSSARRLRAMTLCGGIHST